MNAKSPTQLQGLPGDPDAAEAPAPQTKHSQIIARQGWLNHCRPGTYAQQTIYWGTPTPTHKYVQTGRVMIALQRADTQGRDRASTCRYAEA